MVMPFSRSSSPESIARSATPSASCAEKAPAWSSIASTRVVLPWSTCATMATLRRSARVVVDMICWRLPGRVRQVSLSVGLRRMTTPESIVDRMSSLPAASPAPAFRVLFVCIGNVCRSPVGERLLAARLPADRFEVGSAGVGAMVGYAMSKYAAAELEGYGGSSTGFAARQLTPELIEDA